MEVPAFGCMQVTPVGPGGIPGTPSIPVSIVTPSLSPPHLPVGVAAATDVAAVELFNRASCCYRMLCSLTSH